MKAFNLVNSAEAYAAALEVIPARYSYQRDLLAGRQAISGSTLRGKARSYKPHYRNSAKSLLKKLEKAGIAARVERIGRRDILVIG